jgi:hypothetical protein
VDPKASSDLTCIKQGCINFFPSFYLDGEKPYEEQNRMGRILFINLFDTGEARQLLPALAAF